MGGPGPGDLNGYLGELRARLRGHRLSLRRLSGSPVGSAGPGRDAVRAPARPLQDPRGRRPREDTVITRRQLSAVMADGARVVDTAGHPMGRIVDVVLDVRTMEPVYMTVACVLHAGATGILPLRPARLVDGAVRVQCTAADICGAPH